MTTINLMVCGTLALVAAMPAVGAEDTLDEVVVFATRAGGATKTDTAIIEIPQSISVVTSAQIEERGALNYQEVFRYSGVDTERSGMEVRGDFFSLRGFALKQYVDGLNKTPDFVYGSRQEVFTLERVEILRGPAAVMYGAGSSGGIVNAVSKRPQFDFGGSLGLQVGNFERRQVQADITGPFSETFAGRLVGVVREGELLSPGQPNDKFTILPSITWQPTENTSVTLIGLYAEEDLGTHTYLPTDKTLLASADNPAVAHDLFVGEPGFNHMDAKDTELTLAVSHRFSDMITLNSNNRYAKQTVDYAEVYGFAPYADEPANTLLRREWFVLDGDYKTWNSDTNVQLDFKTGSLEHKVLVGLDYTKFEHGRQEGFSCRDFPFPPCWEGGSPPPLDVYDPVYGLPFTFGFTNAYETESTQLGFYVQDQMRWNDKLSFVAGVRRDSSSNQRVGEEKLKQYATTFKAGLIFEVVEGISPYVSYSEAFTPLFGTDFYGVQYSPQEAQQYEGGIKWQPNDQSLVSVAYFDIEETGFLSQDPDNIQNFLQGGAVGVKGFEFEASLGLGAGFTVIANYVDVSAEVIEGLSSQPAGTRVPNLPEEIGSLWVTKQFVVTDDLAWRLGAGVRRNGDETDGFGTITPAVTIGDVMAEVSFRDWNLTVNVNNVSDKEYFSECGSFICAPALTRSIVGTVSKKF